MRSLPGRRALRLLVALLIAVGLVGAAGPASASPAPPPRPTYLALGDSVPFGYRANLPPLLYKIPQLFVGYPELVGPALGLRTLNASCPGESTTSFLTGAGSNGCEDNIGGPAYRPNFPLHVHYTGTQLDYALETLTHNPSVRLVTLQLGTNDAFLCQKLHGGTCDASQLQAVLATVYANLVDILSQLRGVYDGKIAVVTYYALNYKDPSDPLLQGVEALNGTIAKAAAQVPGVVVADGFTAFEGRAMQFGGSSIAAGLVLPNDVHPTLLGQFLLARAVEQAVGH